MLFRAIRFNAVEGNFEKLKIHMLLTLTCKAKFINYSINIHISLRSSVVNAKFVLPVDLGATRKIAMLQNVRLLILGNKQTSCRPTGQNKFSNQKQEPVIIANKTPYYNENP